MPPRFRQSGLAVACNLLVPGSGLIVTQRDLVGALLALLFAVAGQIALAGLLIAPLAIPGWLTMAATVACGAIWLAAQGMLLARLRRWRRRDARENLQRLLADADAALAANDLAGARLHLEHALTIDDEDVDANLAYARLLDRIGVPQARAWWKRVARLDRAGVHAPESDAALSRSVRADR